MSLEFLALVTATFGLYHLLPRGMRAEVLAASSLVYISWFGLPTLGTTLCLIGANYLAGMAQGAATPGTPKRRAIFAAIVAFDILALGLAKYKGLLPVSVPVSMLGMSYYVFLLIGYQADVYLDKAAPELNLARFGLFSGFFAKFQAGPIERTGNLLSQIRSGLARPFDSAMAVSGLRLFAFGMVKKLVIADNISFFIDPVYANPGIYRPSSVLLAVVLYSFHILYDFSSYTDMARGVGRLFGFELLENFRVPYLASNIVEFWRRWHISLSCWLRDYLYIPLGGNRKGVFRQKLNIIIIFFVCGVWHGGTWNFALWGLAHAGWHILTTTSAGLVAWLRRNRAMEIVLRFIGVLVTFHFVTAAWILFRSPDLGTAWAMLNKAALGYADLLGLETWRMALPQPKPLFGYTVFLIAMFEALSALLESRRLRFDALPQPVRWASYLCGAALVAVFASFGKSQFIYFQF